MSELRDRTLGAEKTAIVVAGMLVWEWFAEHKRDVLVRRKIFGVFSVVITVEDMRPLFVRLFGQPQEGI